MLKLRVMVGEIIATMALMMLIKCAEGGDGDGDDKVNEDADQDVCAADAEEKTVLSVMMKENDDEFCVGSG